MKIFIASDHAGYELKEFLKLAFEGQDIVDLGCESNDSVNYPDFAHKISQEVLKDTTYKGILICGSGIGMSITANRYKGIRAALCSNKELAKLSRQHNNANILVLGARFIEQEQAKNIVDTWLQTEFEGGRHEKRVELIDLG
ncbi:MAG: ribose 5-phosphate isomerase B [Candidatus Caenarcaniphilales bacterium]|nr:ribose 5-phosphate isomerase B [Candidatus Caenarcaniphilales bacterium]